VLKFTKGGRSIRERSITLRILNRSRVVKKKSKDGKKFGGNPDHQTGGLHGPERTQLSLLAIRSTLLDDGEFLTKISMSASFIKVKGTKFVVEDSGTEREIVLRGAGLGGWMKYVSRSALNRFLGWVHRAHRKLFCYRMENFISG